ncbi:uncharacterized protein LOC123319783 [Coccinella septempunctata]|uniref:uncharacterized protein LOC123319783 n=1 Tax=Coccinella septempunctata TaxID=41139 RepID=UPI001D06DB3C|nr:uncharacterized protein LOC123319783 [Coccinella septempunctata]
MFVIFAVLILHFFPAFSQDESYFDVFSIPGVPWKTRDPHKLERPKDELYLETGGYKLEDFLGNYRKNLRYKGQVGNAYRRHEKRNDSDVWTDVEKYSDYKRWSNHDKDSATDQNEKKQDQFEVQSQQTRKKTWKDRNDDLQSEYGDFTAPNDRKKQRFEQVPIKHANASRKPEGFRPTGLSHVQKITKAEVSNLTKQNVNRMLRNFVNRLYRRKYGVSRYAEIDPDDIDGEKSKFFGNGLDALALLKNKTKSIANKFLNVFQVVKFNNTECQATLNGLSYLGVCYLAAQCDSLNGTAGGSCADGYGVCCVFRGSCGGGASQNCSYFESPNYPDYYPSNGGVAPPVPTPTPTPGTTTPDLRPDPRLPMLPRGNFGRQMGALECTFSVSKASSDIQQMRIDFLDFELLGPTDGNCINEMFVITGNGLNNQIPSICGYNTGQHIYVDVSMLSGPLMLSVLSNMSYRKRFRIRICQYSQSACITPSNCLQYYTGTSGIIQSFNYDQALMLSRSSPSYFNNLNYAICIRREAGYCSITYSNVMNGLEYPFELVNYAANGQPTVMMGQAGIETFDCPNDYIIINGVRLCGTKLNDGMTNPDLTVNAPVTDNSLGPIVIQVRTNGSAVGRGFKLFYTQNRCS